MSTPAETLPQQQSDASPLRFVTAASLFDGHDAAINIMRRLIQAQGAEVVHLGHNRSVEDVVRAALQEYVDVHYRPEPKKRKRPASFVEPEKRV